MMVEIVLSDKVFDNEESEIPSTIRSTLNHI